VFVSQGYESLVFLLWFIAAAVGIVETTMRDVVVCGVPAFRRPERFRLYVMRSYEPIGVNRILDKFCE